MLHFCLHPQERKVVYVLSLTEIISVQKYKYKPRPFCVIHEMHEIWVQICIHKTIPFSFQGKCPLLKEYRGFICSSLFVLLKCNPHPQGTCEPVEPAHIQGQKSSCNRRNRPSLYWGPLTTDCSCFLKQDPGVLTLYQFPVDDAPQFTEDKQKKKNNRIKALACFRGFGSSQYSHERVEENKMFWENSAIFHIISDFFSLNIQWHGVSNYLIAKIIIPGKWFTHDASPCTVL